MSEHPKPQDCWCGEAQAGLCPTPERCGERAVAAQEYARKLIRSRENRASTTRGGTMRVRFIIPNRNDPTRNPTLHQYAEVTVVPRVGEAVYLGPDEDSAIPWIVKWVGHTLTVPVESDEPAGGHRIAIRLIEPDHWTQRGD